MLDEVLDQVGDGTEIVDSLTAHAVKATKNHGEGSYGASFVLFSMSSGGQME